MKLTYRARLERAEPTIEDGRGRRPIDSIASPGQIRAIYLTARDKHGLTDWDVDERCQANFGTTPANLTKTQASDVIAMFAIPPPPTYEPPWRQERTEQEARLRELEQAYHDACDVGASLKERMAVLGERIEKGRAKIADYIGFVDGDKPPADWLTLLDRLEVEYAELSVDQAKQDDLVTWSYQMFDTELRDYEQRVDADRARAGEAM